MDWMNIQSVESRACIIWLFGEYNKVLGNQAADILRILLLDFTKEDILVKKQILNFSAKLFATKGNTDNVVGLLFQYACQLSSFDLCYDLRDRCRTLKFLLSKSTDNIIFQQHALQLVCAVKPSPSINVSFDPNLFLGSLSNAFDKTIDNYRPIKPWSEEIDSVGLSARNIKTDNNVCNLYILIIIKMTLTLF